MYLETNKMKIFGEDVLFSAKELAKLKSEGISIDEGFMEFLLSQNHVDAFPAGSSSEDRHRICINAVDAFKARTLKGLEVLNERDCLG